ncbi:MAG: hypothetical protein A2Y34_08845 [Spirochaetes bacterium GWC1_27_15]|nr:MAG: hypothetical protein A2Y34_08845 [Spirochaetes bacterium GWC1_27_15]
MNNKKSMRIAATHLITELGAKYDNLIGLGADGKSIFLDFIKLYPDRYIDVGIAESNLVGIASGLSRSSKKVIVSTMACFLTRKAYEQILLDVCVPNLDVIFIGIGVGLSYGTLGTSHHSIDDIALMNNMPNMCIFSPSDYIDARWALSKSLDIKSPCYIRFNAVEATVINNEDDIFEVGIPKLVRDGKNLVIITTGSCVYESILAANNVEKYGISVKIINMITIKPINEDCLLELIGSIENILVIEEHIYFGGLGSILSLILHNRKKSCRFYYKAIKSLKKDIANYKDLLELYELDSLSIEKEILKIIGEKI